MRSRLLPTVPWQDLPETYRSILRELGHTKQTYERVQQAEELLQQVNQSMRRRRGKMRYSLGSLTGPTDVIWRRR